MTDNLDIAIKMNGSIYSHTHKLKLHVQLCWYVANLDVVAKSAKKRKKSYYFCLVSQIALKLQLSAIFCALQKCHIIAIIIILFLHLELCSHGHLKFHTLSISEATF